MREHFLLDPSVVFLNHGSFGATPAPVFETHVGWQREMERQPVEFIARRTNGLLRTARERLGEFLNAGADDLVFVTNATWGVNVAAYSLLLQAGDEILATDHEYGACFNAWRQAAERTGAVWVEAQIPLPLPDPETVADLIWAKVTPRTKVLYLSHITSPTGLIFPVAELCKRARAAGIISVIDGAHAPGQIPLDLTAVGADIYTGNLHKWLSAPKGAGFLYARPELHETLHARIVSWGYTGRSSLLEMEADSLLAMRHQYQGTRDVSAFLSVPAAIDFFNAHDWPTLREGCHALAADAQRRVAQMTGIPAPVPEHSFAQMALCELPADTDLGVLKARLYDEYRVEIPVIDWGGRKFVRVSIQAYNTPSDVDALINALEAIL